MTAFSILVFWSDFIERDDVWSELYRKRSLSLNCAMGPMETWRGKQTPPAMFGYASDEFPLVTVMNLCDLFYCQKISMRRPMVTVLL